MGTPRRGTVYLGVMAAVVLASGCNKVWSHRCADSECLFSPDEWKLVQTLADVSSKPPPADPSNRYLPIDAWQTALDEGVSLDQLPPVVKLGRRLYHDPRLSGDGLDPKDSMGRVAGAARPPGPCSPLLGISCATCHDPVAYGSDVTSVPPNVSNGAGWYDVNTQQTLNVARFHPFFYWNGRTTTLWAQAAQVMESAVSMKGHRGRTLFVVSRYYLDAEGYGAVFSDPSAAEIQRLAAGLTFSMTTKAYRDAYSAAPKGDQDAITRVHVNVAKAIAAYEWFLRSDGSPFDRFVRAGASSDVLGPSQKRGLKLFIGHAGCINCHNTSLFSDGKFHDIGVPQAGEHVPTVPACVGGSAAPSCDCRDGGADKSCLPSGAYGGVQKRKNAEFGACSNYDDRRTAGSPDGGADGGALSLCIDQQPPSVRWGSWRTPSLRDVAMTGPYMHDGVIATLADVVWHYDQGRGSDGDAGSELAPLLLSEQDRADLVSFLESLTGTPGPAVLVAPPPAPDGGYMVCPPPSPASDGGVGEGGTGNGGAGEGGAGAGGAGDGGSADGGTALGDGQ
jgi:cytochrome c peroxidase